MQTAKMHLPKTETNLHVIVEEFAGVRARKGLACSLALLQIMLHL